MTLIYLLVAVVALAYLGLPLLIKAQLKIQSRPGIQHATESYLPGDVQEYFAATSPKLTALGFERAACFTMDGATPDVKPHVSLWMNRSTKQMAAATVLIAMQGDKPPKVTRYVEFVTKLTDGSSVTTSNSPELGAFKPVPSSDTLSAARLQEVAHVHKLHAWRERQFLDASIGRFMPEPGKEVPAFADMLEESIRRQVDTGYLEKVADDEGVYQPTLAGAYAMTWKQLPPMKNLNRSAEDKRAESQIRQAASAGSAATPPAPARRAA